MDGKEKNEAVATNRQFQLKIITDLLTGLPVLDAGPGAPAPTSKEVKELLIDFP